MPADMEIIRSKPAMAPTMGLLPTEIIKQIFEHFIHGSNTGSGPLLRFGRIHEQQPPAAAILFLNSCWYVEMHPIYY